MEQRILKQDSLFIFGQPKIENTPLKKIIKEIVIQKEDKNEIRKGLKRLGITERTLFKDLLGFAATHGYNKSLPPGYGDAEYYFRKGNEALQRGDNRGAIADYGRAIDLNPEYVEAYYNRGLAKSNLGNHRGAIADYARAIKHKPDYAEAYYNRGQVYASLGNEKKARRDFSKARELAEQSGDKQLLGLIDKALSELDNGNSNK